MTYTMSIRRQVRDLQSFDFDQAIEVLTLRNQGWTFDQIGKKIGHSRMRACAIYKKIKGMTVEEAELYRNVINKLPIYKHKK